ncbi:MAG: hypothetical protein ACLFS1_04045 [Opitutales bacterium]
MLETTDIPNLGALCQLSETGLMKLEDGNQFNRLEKLGDLTGLRSLAISNSSSQSVLERSFEFDRYEKIRGLSGFEKVLDAKWESFDFFYVHLDGEYQSILEICDPKVEEWIKMVDAWLPGLLGYFQPDVFALSGDLDAVVSGDTSILSMIHSPRSQVTPGEALSPRTCRQGRLGEQVDLRQWLLLLMALSSRRESYHAALELYSR